MIFTTLGYMKGQCAGGTLIFLEKRQTGYGKEKQKIEPKDLTVFPNPASETLHIILKNEAISKIRLFEVTGKIVAESEPLKGIYEYSIPLKGIKQGLYFLEVVSETKAQSRVKIVIQH